MKINKSILAVSILFALSTGPINAASVQSYIIDADNYIEKHDYRAAVIQLKNALQQAPDNIDARIRLGNLYIKLGDGPSAEKEFRRGRKHGAKPDDWMPGLADAMLIQRKANEVLSDFLIKSDMTPILKADIYSRQAQANLLLRKDDEANVLFQKALNENPDHVFSLLADARLDARAGKYKSAEVKIAKVIQLEPDNVIALTFEAELLKQQGELKLAQGKFDNVLKIRPGYILAKIGRAHV